MPQQATAPAVPALELRHVTMRFGSFRALNDVSMTVGQGEIAALLGQNGSGKSTLVKVLAGINAPDSGGELYLNGEEIPLPLAPGQFRSLGMSFVHQDLGLARPLTVTENLVVGERAAADEHRPISWRAERQRVKKILDSYNVNVDPMARIDALAPVGQALVAIVRAAEELKLYRERGQRTHSLLFLDEPTVFLPEQEVEFLFDLVRTVVSNGASVVFISHDLSAVRTLCDRAVVLRDGELAGEAKLSDVTDDQLVELIVGPAGGQLARYTRQRQATANGKNGETAAGKASGNAASGPAGLRQQVNPAGLRQQVNPAGLRQQVNNAAGLLCEVRGLRAPRVRDVSLDIAPGEIVGVAGLLGSGADDLPYLLFGASASEAGEMTVDKWHTRLPGLTPFDAVRHKVAMVPADRRRDAIVAGLTVAENSTILVADDYTSAGRLQWGRLRALVGRLIEKFDVRPRNPQAKLSQLSGGNQQRVVLAKWLEIQPRLLLLHEPTQGVDVAARAAIYRLVREATRDEAGHDTAMGTLWVSSDFEELAAVCDRVLIMADGTVRSEISGSELSEDSISSAVYYYSTDAASVLADSEN